LKLPDAFDESTNEPSDLIQLSAQDFAFRAGDVVYLATVPSGS